MSKVYHLFHILDSTYTLSNVLSSNTIYTSEPKLQNTNHMTKPHNIVTHALESGAYSDSLHIIPFKVREL